MRQFVVFKLQGQEFGIDIHKVLEIVQMQEITRIPQASELIEGVINLRGKIIPIVDLKKRYYGLPTTEDEKTRIIVVDVGNQAVGIMADDVSEVLHLHEDMIAPPPTIGNRAYDDGVQGIGKLDKRLLILLDMTKTFTTDEKCQLEEALAN